MLDTLEEAAISKPNPFCSFETYCLGSTHCNAFSTFDPQREERR